MEKAFRGCNNLVNNANDIPNLSSVTNTAYMFGNCALIGTGTATNWSSWNVSGITDMLGMFYSAPSFNKPIGSWTVNNVTNMVGMFRNATSFNQDISSWVLSSVIDINGMFRNATAFNQYIGSWSVSAVTDMNKMFYGATAFNQNIGDWNISNVINMIDMFKNSTLSTTNYDALLIGWNSQTLQPNLNFHGGNATYCSDAAQTARANMIALDNWAITDGGLETGCTSLNIEKEVISDLKVFIYPNPANEMIHISSELVIKTIEVFDLVGKKVLTTNQTKININHFKTGIYVVKITTDKGPLVSRLIKK